MGRGGARCSLLGVLRIEKKKKKKKKKEKKKEAAELTLATSHPIRGVL